MNMRSILLALIASLNLGTPTAQNLDGPVTHDRYTCEDHLVVTCDQTHVVAGELYGVSLPGSGFPGASENCPSSKPQGECLGHVSYPEINQCLWKESTCVVDKSPMVMFTGNSPCAPPFPDLLVVKGFHCVEKPRIYDVCTHTRVEHDEGYVMSPSYPLTYSSGLNCSLAFPPNTNVFVRVLSADMPGNGCDLDYLQIHDGNGEIRRFCEKTDQNSGSPVIYNLKAPVSLTFHSRPFGRTYEGFVLYFKANPNSYDVSYIPSSVISRSNGGRYHLNCVIVLALVVLIELCHHS